MCVDGGDALWDRCISNKSSYLYSGIMVGSLAIMQTQRLYHAHNGADVKDYLSGYITVNELRVKLGC